MIRINFLLFIIISFIIFQCAPAPRYTSNPTVKIKNTKKKDKKSKSKINNKTYNPNKKIYKGIASFYGPKFHGKLTANGEIFDMYGVTAAHKEFPFNTVARVTNENNGKSLILRINDRGPYIDGRMLDCSYGAAHKLGFVVNGTTKVKIEILEWGDGEYMHHDKFK